MKDKKQLLNYLRYHNFSAISVVTESHSNFISVLSQLEDYGDFDSNDYNVDGIWKKILETVNSMDDKDIFDLNNRRKRK